METPIQAGLSRRGRKSAGTSHRCPSNEVACHVRPRRFYELGSRVRTTTHHVGLTAAVIYAHPFCRLYDDMIPLYSALVEHGLLDRFQHSGQLIVDDTGWVRGKTETCDCTLNNMSILQIGHPVPEVPKIYEGLCILSPGSCPIIRKLRCGDR